MKYLTANQIRRKIKLKIIKETSSADCCTAYLSALAETLDYINSNRFDFLITVLNEEIK